jgi:predicted esterase
MTAHDLSFVHRYIPAERPGLPTLLLLHGTGGDENDLVPIGQLLMAGAGILSPRGKVLENGMPRYFRRLAAGAFDLEDLRFRTNELADFVTSSARTNGFEPSRVVAVGYSNGANIGASLLLLWPGLLASAILLHAQVPLQPVQSPDLTGTPIFLSGGRGDPLIPPAETERLAALLSASGADVTLHWEAGGHALGRSEVEAARRWLTEQAAAGAI